MDSQQLIIGLVPIIVVIALIAGTLLYRRRGYNVGSSHTVVRCLDGHLFTTVWLPGVSLKALRFGPFRFQRCPVGNHLTFVTPVRPEDLTNEERRFAEQHHDTSIP